MTQRPLFVFFTLIGCSLAYAACTDGEDEPIGATGGESAAAGAAEIPGSAGGRPGAGGAAAEAAAGEGGRSIDASAGAGGQPASAGGLAGAEAGGSGGAAALSLQLATDNRLEGVDASGAARTLYFHGGDLPSSEAAPAVSRCSAVCAQTWPPFHAEDVVVGEGLRSQDFAELARDDGSPQTTYRGWPVYTYAPDTAPGAHQGEGMEELWHAATEPFPTLILMRQSEPVDSGLYLASGSGHTLYRLLGDQPGSASADPISTCTTTGCKKAWPVFAPARVKPVSSLSKQLAIFIRPDDGQVQLAYDGLPLYFFASDLLPGDLFGVGKPSWVLATP